MAARKSKNGLIIPEKFLAELRVLLGPGPCGCRLNARRASWVIALMENFGLGGLTPEDLASNYEQIYSDRADRKKAGLFYTPPEIVDKIIDEALGGWVETHPGETPRILEPSCGAGIFALRLMGRMHALWKTKKPRVDDFARWIFGHLRLNDTDPVATDMAMACLIKKLQCLGEEFPESTTIQVSNLDFLDTTRWDAEGYDIIIGNPPYISYYARGSQGISEEQRGEWCKHFISAGGRVNTFLLFIEMGIKLLKPGGRLGFIIPNTFLIMKSYEKLRRHVLDTCHLRYISDLSLGVFPGAEVPSCIIVLEKRDPVELHLDHPVKVDIQQNADAGGTSTIDTGRFRKLPYLMFNIGLDPRTCEIIDRMESGAEQMKSFVDVRDGINPANVKSKIVASSQETPKHKPLLVGRDIKPYSIEWSGLFVNYDPGSVDKSKGEYCFLREERIFLAEKKLVHRQTARRLIAALDDERYYALNSCHLSLVEDDRMDILYLLALYNSNLLNFYYAVVFRDTEKVFPQVKTANIEKLPVKFGDPAVLAEIVSYAADLSSGTETSASKRDLCEKIEGAIVQTYGMTEKQLQFIKERASH